MRNKIFGSTLVSLLLLIVALSPAASAQNRLPQAITAESTRIPVSNSVLPIVKGATDIGETPGDTKLESLSLRFNMTAAQSAALDQLLADQLNPASPRYHQWLTPAQFGQQFGMSDADLATVTNWLKDQGFTVTGIANGRQFVSFSGTVAQVNQAFGVTLHKVQWNGEQHFSNLSDPVLPAALANVVQSVVGLNDFHPHSRAIHRIIQKDAKYSGSNGYGNLIAPGDFYTIYDESPLLTAGTPINGSGVTIGVMGQVDVYTTDLTAFRTAAGLSTTNLPTQVSEGTTPPAPSSTICASSSAPSSCGDLEESTLDLEWSGAVAPAASIKFVTGADVFGNAMTQAIDQNLAPILTVSYGNCEAGFGTAYIATYNALFKQANAQGQTVLGPSGDQGATDCDGSTVLAENGLAVDFPASSPYVTAVGGTEFDEGAGVYWSNTNGTNAGSALSYIPEQPWNEFFDSYPSSNIPLAGLEYGGGTGGGVSSVFSKPSWQTGAGVPADASRDVPDVAYNAAANHDGYLVCAFGSCTNNGFSYTTSGGLTEYYVFGGTSVSTPAFAATLALLEQKTGGSLGNVNPKIYGLAASIYDSAVFHAKTSGGTNAAPCAAGYPDCTAGFPNYYAASTIACPANSCTGDIAYPAIGYLAASGYNYDLATGWGSVDIKNFVNDFSLATPTTTTTSSNNASAVTVTASSTSVASGATVTISATVASSTSGVTATPTGTAQLLVDGVAFGSPVTLSSGSATLPAYTVPNTALCADHTFSVSYSGDSTYAGSIGSKTVAYSSATCPDFSISPTSPTITVSSGGVSSPLAFTISSLNGFSGTVSLNITNFSNATFDNDSVECLTTTTNCSSTLNSVSVSSSSPGVFNLLIYAYYNPSTGYLKKRAANSAQPLPGANPWALGMGGVALASLLCVGLPRRRQRWSALLVAMVTAAVLASGGCSGPSGSSNSNNGNTNAPTGTSTFVLTATGTSGITTVTHSVTVSVTVQ
jgi:subtilase family serine protease